MNDELGRIERLQLVMMEHGKDLVLSLVVLIVGLLVVRFAMRLIRKGLDRVFKKAAIAATIANVIHIILLAAVLMAAAIELGLQVRPVFRLAAAVFLVVIGLIIFFRPYIPSLPFKVGQTVNAQGLLGKVEGITFINTQIKTFDGKMVFVPNKNIVNDIVINYHYTPSRRMKLDVPIRYDQDLMKAKQTLEAVMIEDPRILTKPRPAVWVLDMSRGCVVLGGRCWADNSKYWQARVDLLEKIKLRFDREGIVISYPHIGVHHYPADWAEDEAMHEMAAAERTM